MLDGESGFQKALDAAPNDQGTRLVYADWLDDHGDSRADGYRAIARCGLILCDRFTGPPVRYVPNHGSRVFCLGKSSAAAEYSLPADWYALLVVQKLSESDKGPAARPESDDSCALFRSRLEAENAAALSFAKLPHDRRAELLTGNVGTAEQIQQFARKFDEERAKNKPAVHEETENNFGELFDSGAGDA